MSRGKVAILLFALIALVFLPGATLVAEEGPAAAPSTKTEPAPAVSVHETASRDGATHGAEPSAGPKSEAVEEAVAEDVSCLTGAALEDLARQKENLATRERELAAKEGELRNMEKVVREEFVKLEQARTELGKLNELRKKENEEKVAKIVETVETMSPKPAAILVASLDDMLAITAMQRISTVKLAKIMNVMEPGRSSRLTELLAGVVRVGSTGTSSSRNPASKGAAGPAISSAKGGEENDGQSESISSGAKKR